MAELWPNMYPLVAKKWTKQKSNPIIQIACQKEAYPENFINLGWPQAKWIHHLPTWLQGVDDIYPHFNSCPKNDGVLVIVSILLLRPSKTSDALKKGPNFGFLTFDYAFKN